jgi:DNA polymerase-3 subunit beta
MKFSVRRDDLLTPLQSVIGVVEKRQTLPILSNFLINIIDGKMTITGTDLKIEISTSLQLEDHSINIDFTVPAKKLFDICKNMDSDTLVNFEIQENKIILQSSYSRFMLSSLPASNFPNLDPINSVSEFVITERECKYLIEKTQFSMAHQDVRYYLNGLLFEINNNELRSVATDGHRLAFSYVDSLTNTVNLSTDNTQQLIIPRKGILELNRLLSDSEEKLKFFISPNYLSIKLNSIHFYSKLIDGRFPDYHRVIPVKELCSKNIVADRFILKQSLTRIAVLSNEKFKAARLEFSMNKLTAVIHNPEQEEAQEKINIDYNGDNFVIGFNVNYLIDALNNIDQDQVVLSLTDANSSCLISGFGDDYTKYVVMPMRL